MALTITTFAHLQIPLEDIEKATDNFSKANIIGSGGFGPAYKGKILQSGKLIKIVALRLDRRYGLRDVDFWTEISVLSDLKHTNLVSLIGFCDEKDEKIIVITHEANGSLAEHLNSQNLTWKQRLRISLGVARALSYLHHDKGRAYGVIHRNINSSSILLGENWEAKLSGFIVSIKQPVNRKEHVVLSEPVATIGYIDPEVEKTGGVTYKSDIYSLGVVLFEILCGRKAFIQNGANRFLAPLAKSHYESNTLEDIIDPNLWNQMFPRSLLKYSNVAYSCLQEELADRPNMDYIVAKLEKALELQLRGENLGKNSEHLKIQLNDIRIATNNFSDTYRFEVSDFNSWYRAEINFFNKETPEEKSKSELPARHDTVIIKRFHPRDEEEENLALIDIEMLASVKHHNIVTLIGYCVEGSEMMRVIENVSNGNLYDYLRNVEDMRIFTWEKRLKICVDIAKALNYLHFEMEDKKVMVHGDIRSCNIELFENWVAKLDEFEEAVFLPVNQEDEARRRETTLYLKYYVDPEYKNTGTLKRESDVYGFGVVLFEILCGRTADDLIYLKESDIGLAHAVRQNYFTRTLEDMIDPIIKEESVENNFVKDSLHTFIEIALQCVGKPQDQRPTMKVVLRELEKAFIFQENKDNLRVSLEDVKLATQNFHDDNCFGRGSFGKVYKGKVPQGDVFNTIVAQRLDARLGQGIEQFSNELQILLEYKHDNVISLIGYCDEKDEKVIVYEYMSRSLDRYLNDDSLTWTKRLNICIDVASALDFLHGGVGREAKVVIHRDIKTSNILLNDDWTAKLAGFGLSFISTLNQETDYDVCGTSGYLDPLYIKSGFLTKESDIYSFGIVLFEILCGRSTLAIHQHEGYYLADFIENNFEEGKHDEIVFEQIKEQIAPKSLTTFQTIAYQCLHHEREKRPTTKEVLMQLKKALEFQEKQVQDPNSDQDVMLHQLKLEIHGKNMEHLKIRLSDIESATNNFSDTYKIPCDSNDCAWYRAELNHPKGHNIVVIKRYHIGSDAYGEEEFLKEIKVLTSVEHPNIGTLLGFCVEGFEKILVTENFSNGHLSSYLGNINNMRVLTWEIRLKICIDVAHALNYLHYEMKDQKIIINRDIASENIWLDESWGAKIFEFGVSLILPPNQEDALYLNSKWREFYVDPEHKKTYKLKRESDVYSFGVVLFEILCGRKAYDLIYRKESDEGLAVVAKRNFRSGTLKDMIDPVIKEETGENSFVLNRGPNEDSLRIFIEIAYQCVAETQVHRPPMNYVIKELEKALLFQKTNKDNPRIPLQYVKVATQDFHVDNCIGGGGFGKVYKGRVQYGDGFNTIVAKRLDTRFGQGENQFLTELQILLEYKHENIIGLLGYCNENDEKIIICEYASRRSLDRYLNDASLTWVKRLNICIEVASALYFLHEGEGRRAKVIHRDIKAANILLNHDWKAKLADFGLSIISPLVQETDYVIDHACGTPGYFDPLYRELGFLTIESDIYSFGVVLFEILCGRSNFAVHKHEGHYLPVFIKKKFEEGKHYDVVFEQIREQIVSKSLTTFQDIAYQCLHPEREKRPTTKKVLTQLKKALEFQNMASTMTKFAHSRIPLEDVIKATTNFHDNNIIRHGKCGTTYKGQLLRSGRLLKIAAKRFDCKHDLEFLTEISVLYDLKHTNLVSFIGFCDEKDEKIIMTTHEANGSLGDYLNSPNLTWTHRLRICVGVAHVLCYLHYDNGHDCNIIHCNINSDTILLDENLEAKLSGFEIAIRQSLCYQDRVFPCERIGTMGYIDPAIEKTGGVTNKSDIYSFGVVLFEILCGRKAFIQNKANRFLAPFAKYHYEHGTLHDHIIHLDLQMSPKSFLKYVDVAYLCINEDGAHRPNINYIIYELEEAYELQQLYENVGENLERLKIQHLKIRLMDIIFATDNFSEKYRILCDDNYSCYRAELHHFDKQNPSTVVIKHISCSQEFYQEEHFVRDFEVVSRVKHPNIVTIFGFCVEASEMILVIENLSNGFLGDYLSNSDKCRVLTWEKRLKICIDVAHALDYLHSKMEDQNIIIHRNVCCFNIGLDDNWGAKMVDFHFSVFLPPNQEDVFLPPNQEDGVPYLGWLGRTVYRDPEYEKNGKLKSESDVYSFGVLLFEVLCGRTADDPIYMKKSEKGLAPLARNSFYMGTLHKMIDPIIMEETSENNFSLNRGPNKDSLHVFIEIANQCVAETQDQRPTMKVVVKELEKALFFQENNKDNPKIPLKDIKLATQNFHENNCIGGEGFGKIYKGNLQDGDRVNTIVAKLVDIRFGQGIKQFLSELQFLWEYKHENIIGLVGYCDEQDEKIIVYEYASRGSLDRYLNDVSLTWMKRLNICIDVASALHFIHGGVGNQAKLIHRDIKTSNILLNDYWKAKLTAFGNSLTGPITRETEYVFVHAVATPGYTDPLYEKSGFLTMESDIYSFGVVLFEILCGRSTHAIHQDEGHYLSDFIKSRFEEGKHDEVVFKQIKEQIVPESLTTFQEIAYQCLHHEREKRPTTKQILTQLMKALEFQVISSLSPNHAFKIRTRLPGRASQIMTRPLHRFGSCGIEQVLG